MQRSVQLSPYPSPPYLPDEDDSSYTDNGDSIDMGANDNPNMNNAHGVGALTYQRAIDVARNTEGELDPTISAYLEGALQDIWHRIGLEPETYVMTRDEFAVFNYYRNRTEGNGIAEQAVARYWANARQAATGAY